MELISPTKKYEQSWRQALLEFETEGETGFWNIPEKPSDIDAYIELTENHSKGMHLPDFWVPATTYWLVDNDFFVGHVNIRRCLNKKLEKRGGHIGFAIRPSARQQGYGMKILELALLKAKKNGLKKVLVTCDDTNIASAKIIEKNGGKLEDKIEVEGVLIRRYWIYLMSDIYDFLKTHDIAYERFDHPAVFTCEEADRIRELFLNIPGVPTKNLFLRDKDGKRHFLVVVGHEKNVDLKMLRILLDVSKLSFGSPDRLQEYLGVTSGAVTLLGLIHDPEHHVEVVFDESLWGKSLQCHPLVNTATLAISSEGIAKFLRVTGHEYRVLEVPGK